MSLPIFQIRGNLNFLSQKKRTYLRRMKSLGQMQSINKIIQVFILMPILQILGRVQKLRKNLLKKTLFNKRMITKIQATIRVISTLILVLMIMILAVLKKMSLYLRTLLSTIRLYLRSQSKITLKMIHLTLTFLKTVKVIFTQTSQSPKKTSITLMILSPLKTTYLQIITFYK